MNKHMLSIALILNVISAVYAGSEFANSWVKVDHNFTIKTVLTVCPTNSEKWELINHNDLKFVGYQFTRGQMPGIVGTQEWTFKSKRTGFQQVKFARAHEVKKVPLTVYQDWCGTKPTTKNPVINF